MTADEYQKEALRTEHTPVIGLDQEKSRLLHAMIGLSTEVGELQDAFKKHLFYDAPLDRVNIMEESLDILWYLVLALDACGYSLQECMDRNIRKLKARYPDKFTRENALQRDLFAERKELEKP